MSTNVPINASATITIKNDCITIDGTVSESIEYGLLKIMDPLKLL